MVGGSDVSQEHVLSLVRVERLGPSLTLQKSEWGCSVIVLASCKAGCIMNHWRRDSSISHFLPHCNYWLGLLWLLLVPSLQLTCVSKSHPHRPNFSNCRWRHHVAPKLQNISIHPEHTWWQKRMLLSECGYFLLGSYLWYQSFILWRWRQKFCWNNVICI